MAYVEAHASLREHPKTKKLARLLGVSRAATIGHMLCLWWWCQEYAEDGDLSAYEYDDIADAADWIDDPTAFVEALLSCGMKNRSGFLAKNDDGTLFVKDWHEYGGKLSIKRAQARERMQAMREREKPVTRALRVTGANVTHDVHDVTHIDQTRLDQTRSDKTRLDAKSVTEKKEKNTNSQSVGQSVSVLLTSYGINTTQYMLEKYGNAIETYGLPAVQAGLSAAADQGRQDWKYVRGCIENIIAEKNKPAVNGVHIVNGKRDISSLIGEIPEDVV